MNKLKSIFLYFSGIVLLGVVPYLLFEDYNLAFVLGLVWCLWSIAFISLDKVLFFQLDAREIIDTDHQDLFQCIKNESYSTQLQSPKVYVYSGKGLGTFVFDSVSNWNVVIDRKLLKKMDQEQMASFVEVLFKYKLSGKSWVNTRAVGICCLLFKFINWLLISVLRLKPNSDKFKALSLVILVFIRPFWVIVEKIAKVRHLIPADKSIESIYLQNSKDEDLYYNYLMSSIDSQKTVKKRIISYIEGFSVIRNCKFN